MNITVSRLDPNLPDPVESRRRAAGRMVRIAYATIVFGVLVFIVVYFGRSLRLTERPRMVASRPVLVSLPYTVQVKNMKVRVGEGRPPGRKSARSGLRSWMTLSPPTCGGLRRSTLAARSSGSRPGRRAIHWKPPAVSACHGGGDEPSRHVDDASLTFRIDMLRERDWLKKRCGPGGRDRGSDRSARVARQIWRPASSASR